MKFHTLGALAAVSLLAACASKPAETSNASTGMTSTGPTGPSYAPGSQEDLVANVGDRVFFELNSTKLSDAATATLDKQAAFLAKYPQDKHRGIQHCPRQPPCPCREGISGGEGRFQFAPDDDQLRQGPPDRARRQRGSLGTEPQRHRIRAVIPTAVGPTFG